MRILAMVALIASTLVAWSANATTDAEFCATMVSIQQEANRDIGRKVDEVTIDRGVFSLCGKRAVIFRKEVLVPAATLRAGWEDRKRVQWNQIMCSEPLWAQKIKAGWLMISEMVFADGVRSSLEAVCP